MTNQTTNKKLLDQVRDTLRLKHYALSTEESYLLWIKRFIFFHKTECVFVHPKDMGHTEIEAFLTYLAVTKKCRPLHPKSGAQRASVSLSRSPPDRSRLHQGSMGQAPGEPHGPGRGDEGHDVTPMLSWQLFIAVIQRFPFFSTVTVCDTGHPFVEYQPYFTRNTKHCLVSHYIPMPEDRGFTATSDKMS